MSKRWKPKPSWSNATATYVCPACLAVRAPACRDGYSCDAEPIRFPSKMEAAVYIRLRGIVDPVESQRLYLQPRFPLFALDPDDRGRAEVFTPDFAVVLHGKLHRVIEAKAAGRVSRDYKLRARAFETTWGVKVEVVDR